MTDVHVLFCAFAEVPGASAAGSRMGQWLSVFGNKEVDALSLKGREAAHIQRLGGARMMRVPNTSGKPFLERLSTYQRALQRQLAGESYELVWCGDLFSAGVVAQALKGRAPMIVEVAEVPSQGLVGRQLVGEDTDVVQKRWREQERIAIRAATKVLLPSRYAAKNISERIDARFLSVVQRCVDTSVFSPPSVEITLDERLVVIFGGREGGAALKAAANIAHGLVARVPPTVRVGILGQPSLADAEVRAALGKKGLGDRIELLDADGPQAVAATLSQAHVVVVPSAAEEDLEPFGIPHRALEAMASGRAVVLTGPDLAFRDIATPGEHYLSTPARDPAKVVDAVMELLDSGEKRNALGRAAAKHLARTADLALRATEVAAVIREATKLDLRMHVPSGDDPDTSSRSVPAPPPRKPSIRSQESGPVPTATSAPAPLLSSQTGPNETAKNAPAPAPSSPGPLAPLPTVRMEAPAFGTEANAAWEGDTFLDGGLPPLAIETNPDADKVRAAMLLSSDASARAATSRPDASPEQQRSAEEASTPDDAKATLPSGEEPVDSGKQPRSRSGNSVPTSLIVQAALESRLPAGDPWAPDTIADGTPIDTGRGLGRESVLQKPPSKKSFLVDKAGATTGERPVDLTAEDAPRTGSDEGGPSR